MDIKDKNDAVVVAESQPVKKLSRYSACMQNALNVAALAAMGDDISDCYIRPVNANERLNGILHQILVYRMVKKMRELDEAKNT
jgi:23S rRNA maturation mini-RNase III